LNKAAVALFNGTGMDSYQRTALSGTLIRRRKNLWAWSDHSPAPDVRDLSATGYYNFRIRNRRWIEVLVRLAREKEALHWVSRGGYIISLSGYHYGPIVVHEDGRMTRASQNGKVIPEVYLVPIADWDAHDQCLATIRFGREGYFKFGTGWTGPADVAVMEVTFKKWHHPITGQRVQFGLSTIERWFYTARNSNPRKLRAH
jgi:hypothetical protein